MKKKNPLKLLFETCPAVTGSFSGCHDVISGPSLDPMHDRARPTPPNPARNAFASNPDPKNTLTVKPVTWAKYGSLIG